jgi:cobalt-precorrin 5A hydrolase
MAGGAVIVAGFGFRAAATVASLEEALHLARQGHDGHLSIACLATAADKAGTAAFRTLALRLDLPTCAIDSAALTAQPTPTRSSASRVARATGSVAEAAALAAAGEESCILVPRVISGDGMATCALAERKDP